jgi:hypothetical protein
MADIERSLQLEPRMPTAIYRSAARQTRRPGAALGRRADRAMILILLNR